MLKIKDNVDLKELEKFGFKRVEYYNGTCWKFTRFIGKHEAINIIIREDNKILKYNIMSVKNDLEDIVFDLIQAGLVEKV